MAPLAVRREPSTPSVSVLIAAHDEASTIAAKIETVLAQPHPRERFEVIVASDGSDDGTCASIAALEHRGVRLLALPRCGKAEALNRAVAVAEGEILVFTDANSLWAGGALAALIEPFADAAVGGVAGDQVYVERALEGLATRGERSYWSLDRWLKLLESRAGSAVSATGALYAIRASLFERIPEGVTDDFFVSSGVVARGYRLVFEPAARVWEPPSRTAGAELERKIRIITRGLWAVVVRRQLLDPTRFGFYSVELFSHKVLRRLTAVPLLVLAAAAAVLAPRGGVYLLAAVLQLGFYGGAAVGALVRRSPRRLARPFTVPFYFCLVNAAAAIATWNVLRGRRITRWETADRG